MLFLQEAPANTTGYMLSGYAVIFGVILLYIISLYVRRKNYQKDIELLQELENRE